MTCPALHGPALPRHSPANCADCRQCGDESAPRVAAAAAAATLAPACACCRHYDEHHGRREHSSVATVSCDADSSGIHLEHDHRVCFFPRRGMSHPGHHLYFVVIILITHVITLIGLSRAPHVALGYASTNTGHSDTTGSVLHLQKPG